MAQTTRTVRFPVKEYEVTRVLTAKADGSETFRVPGLLFTVADIQGCVDNRETSGTADVICATCGESVADCPELAPKLTNVPREWSWQSKVGEQWGE